MGAIGPITEFFSLLKTVTQRELVRKIEIRYFMVPELLGLHHRQAGFPFYKLQVAGNMLLTKIHYRKIIKASVRNKYSPGHHGDLKPARATYRAT